MARSQLYGISILRRYTAVFKNEVAQYAVPLISEAKKVPEQYILPYTF